MMNEKMDCYKLLKERFEYIFEDALLKQICEVGQLKQFEEELTLIDIGSLITHMPIVIRGSIKIVTEDANGDELLLYYLELGDTCAVTLTCCTRQSISSIRAITELPTTLIFIPVQYIEDWMIKYKSWRAFVLESYNERINELLKTIDVLVFQSMEERVHGYLRDKAMITGSGVLKISHYQIANDLHSSRVVISRIMKKLEKNGLLSQGRNQVDLFEFMPK